MFEIMGALIVLPWLALAPATLFFALYLYSRQRLPLAAALLWLAYCAYEYSMALRLLCTGECNIRIDLLLIYPLLLLTSGAGLVAAFRSRKQA